MPILDKNNAHDVARYNAFVKGHLYTSATQDLEWRQLKNGWGDVQFYVEEHGEIKAAMSVLVKKTLGYSMLYAPKGPVVDFYDIHLVTALVDEVDVYAKQHRAYVLKMDPERMMDVELHHLYEEAGFKVRNVGIPYEELIQPRYNMVLKLKGFNEESLLENFSQKTRYNIRLSDKKGVKVYHETSQKSLDIFYELSEIMCTRQKLFNRPKAYFETMLDVFKDNARIYIAEHEGEPLAAAIAIYYGEKMWYIYGASSDHKRNLMPNYLMQWEMIKWALEVGASEYDFGGVFELNKEHGLYKFKEGFCRKDGVTELIGEVDKVYKPLVYKAVMDLYPKFKKLRTKFFGRG